MENIALILKAIADNTRLRIIKLLLQYSYCVGALARRLNISEAAVSQHLKVLREAGLVTGKKRGYFMHYAVNRDRLHILAEDLKKLTEIKTEICNPEKEDCLKKKQRICHMHKSGCPKEARNEAKGEKTS